MEAATRWAVDRGIRHPKKSLGLVELTSSDKRNLVETLRNDYSVHQICETLGFNRSLLYYHPKSDPSEEGLGEEIEKLYQFYKLFSLLKKCKRRNELRDYELSIFLREVIFEKWYYVRVIRNMGIGVSHRCCWVWDTPLGIGASPD